MTQYETVIIANPKVNSKEFLANIKKDLLACDLTECLIQDIGVRKLAYPIKNCNTGYYWEVVVKMELAQFNHWKNLLKKNDKVLKYMNLRVDESDKEFQEEVLKGCVYCSLTDAEAEVKVKNKKQTNGLDVLLGKAEFIKKKGVKSNA